jgi:hypothetical protein
VILSHAFCDAVPLVPERCFFVSLGNTVHRVNVMGLQPRLTLVDAAGFALS